MRSFFFLEPRGFLTFGRQVVAKIAESLSEGRKMAPRVGSMVVTAIWKR